VRKLLVLVVLLLVIFGVADVFARIEAEHLLERRIDSYLPAPTAKVTIGGFPFLPRLVASGRIDKITATATNVGQGSFVFDQATVIVTGVRIDRSQLVQDQKLDIEAIGTGTVTADMTQANFDRLVGAPVILGNGSAQLTEDGVSVTAQVAIVDGQLRVESSDLPISVPIPTLPVLPCLAQVQIVSGQLVGSCTFHQIPPDLKNALQ
jgi:hypothetical protein